MAEGMPARVASGAAKPLLSPRNSDRCAQAAPKSKKPRQADLPGLTAGKTLLPSV